MGGAISWPILAALLWLILANVTGMIPSRRKHWPQAYGLIALGLPIAAWLTWAEGALPGALFVVAGLSVLRWPARFVLRWLWRGLRRGRGGS